MHGIVDPLKASFNKISYTTDQVIHYLTLSVYMIWDMEVMLVEENKRKRGRPIRGIKKRNKDIHVRTTDDTFNKLDVICKSHHCNHTEVIEKLIENQYKLTVNGYNVL